MCVVRWIITTKYHVVALPFGIPDKTQGGKNDIHTNNYSLHLTVIYMSNLWVKIIVRNGRPTKTRHLTVFQIRRVKNPTVTSTRPNNEENDNLLRYSYRLKYYTLCDPPKKLHDPLTEKNNWNTAFDACLKLSDPFQGPSSMWGNIFHLICFTQSVENSSYVSRFPKGSLYTNTHDEGWKMIRVGDTPLGFGKLSVL